MYVLSRSRSFLDSCEPMGFVNEKGKRMAKSKYHTVITSIEMTWIYLLNGWNNQRKHFNSEVLFIMLCLVKR